jgi:hypothetical protein
MAHASSPYRLFVGIDVAATTCAVSWMAPDAQPTRAITIKQTPAGFADLQRQLLAIQPDPNAVLVVMEATGTYWMHLASTLSETGFAVAIINPAQAHDFTDGISLPVGFHIYASDEPWADDARELLEAIDAILPHRCRIVLLADRIHTGEPFLTCLE